MCNNGPLRCTVSVVRNGRTWSAILQWRKNRDTGILSLMNNLTVKEIGGLHLQYARSGGTGGDTPTDTCWYLCVVLGGAHVHT